MIDPCGMPRSGVARRRAFRLRWLGSSLVVQRLGRWRITTMASTCSVVDVPRREVISLSELILIPNLTMNSRGLGSAQAMSPEGWIRHSSDPLKGPSDERILQ